MLNVPLSQYMPWMLEFYYEVCKNLPNISISASSSSACRFFALIKRDSFDYTIWRREYFDKMDLEQISIEAAAYAQNHPHNGKGIRI